MELTYSLGQSVTGIALFIFWLIRQEYNFSQRIILNVKYMTCFLSYILAFRVFVSDCQLPRSYGQFVIVTVKIKY